MKKTLMIATGLVLASGAMFGTTFSGLSPQGTYLFVNTQSSQLNDIVVNPLFINLTTNGYTAGTELIIQGFGNICYGSTCTTSGQELPVTLGGVFSTSSSLASATSNPHILNTIAYVAGSSNSVTDLVTPNSFYVTSQNTNTVPDFGILTTQSLRVIVPNGATFLVIGVIDSYMADNSDPSGNAIGVNITVAGVPEPGTYALMGAGLVGLVALRRKFAR